MQSKIEVGVLGATGMVGQHFVKFLQDHPWFELPWVGASDRSAGKKYRDATSWRLDGAMPERVADLVVKECVPDNAPRLLTSTRHKALIMERLGVSHLLVIPFDAETAALEPADFIERIVAACRPLASITVG